MSGGARLRRYIERLDNGAWGEEPDGTGVEARCIRATDFQYSSLKVNKDAAPIRKFDADSFRRLALRHGDLVVEKSGGTSDRPVGRVVVYEESEPAVCTNFAARLRPANSADPRFLAFLLSSMYADGRTARCINQTTGIQNLNTEQWLAESVAVPPIDEQRRIADFLDDQVARLDAMVVAREEQRRRLAAAAQETVDAAFDSRADRHLVRAARMLRVLPGFAFDSESYSDDDGDCRLLRGINVGVGACKWDDVVYWPATRVSEVSRFLLSPGDLVLGMDRPWIGDGLRIARVTDADAPCLLLQRVAKLEPFESSDPEYLMWAYRASSFRESVEADLTGLSVPHLSGEQILDHRLPELPLAEQRRIGGELTAISEQMESLARRVGVFIDLLNEYKRSLITAAVTGEFDVTTARTGVPA